MTALAEEWVRCRFTDFAIEPEWDRIPEEKREMVRDRWRAKCEAETGEWLLWGPQIPLYQRRSDCRVEVLSGAAQETHCT